VRGIKQVIVERSRSHPVVNSRKFHRGHLGSNGRNQRSDYNPVITQEVVIVAIA